MPHTLQPLLANMLVEIPLGSYIKYEFDKPTQTIKVDRILHTMPYPFNYGYIPHTLSGDGDPLDIVLLSRHTLHPGVIVQVKIIDVLFTEDEKGLDHKIIAIMAHTIDPANRSIHKLDDPNLHAIHGQLIDTIPYFFANYKQLEKEKWVKVHGYQGIEQANKIYQQAVEKT